MAPVTVLQVGPCPVLQVRNQERDGYDALQLGFLDKARRKAIRAERGHVSDALESKRRAARAAAGVTLPPKANCEPQRYIREFRLDKPSDTAVGDAADGGRGVQGREGGGRDRHVEGPRHDGHDEAVRTSTACRPATASRSTTARPAASARTPATAAAAGPRTAISAAGRYGAERVTIRNLRVVASTPKSSRAGGRAPSPAPTAAWS